MKYLLFAAFFILTSKVRAQNIEQKTTFAIAKMNVGYSPIHRSPVIGLEAGLRSDRFYFGANLLTINFTSAGDAPVSTGLIAGYNLGQWQPFISSSYQSIGKENEQALKGSIYEFRNGVKLGGGLSYYLKSIPLCFTGEYEGKELYLVAGMYISF